jgi:[ribosomal protein S5]-alanine N-acetyltransferase
MYPVRISATRLTLRELASSDVDSLHQVYGSPETTKYLSFEPRTVEQVEEIVTSAIKSAQEDPRSVYMLALAEIASDELVGAARLALGEYDSAQVGLALRPDQWGQGKGVEAVRLLQRLGFRALGLHRIWGARSPLNEASARTMTSAGMIEEGTILGHLLTRGAWRNSVAHSILSDEYDVP